MTNAGYNFSYTPKPSSALANLNPISLGEGLRFQADAPMKFIEQRPEVVMEGILKGRQQMAESITEGALSALGNITGAFKEERQAKKEAQEKADQREHELTIWDKRVTAVKPENERDILYDNLRNQLTEQKLLEMENRVNAVTPTAVREKGYFSSDPVDIPIEDMPKSLDEEKKQSSLMNLQTPIPNIASNEPAPILSNINDISAFAPPVDGYSLAGVSAPKTADRIFPTSEGQVNFGGETFELERVSGAEGVPTLASTPAPPPTKAPVSKQQAEQSRLTPSPAEFVDKVTGQPESKKRQPTAYEIEQYYAGEPYGSLADANFAKREMGKLGYKTKVTPIEDPTSKKRIYYVEYEQAGEEPTKGLRMVEATEKDGVITKKYEPEIAPKKKISALDSGQFQLEAMVKSINDIKKLQTEGYLPETGKFSSYLAKLPVTTDASRTRGFLKPILANAAFKAITEMRQASPTGAAVGGVSDKDLELLMNTMGAIDPDNLDDPYFTENLNKIAELAQRTLSGIQNDKVAILKQVKSQGEEIDGIPLVENQAEYDAVRKGRQYYGLKTGQLKLFTKE
jgi:hypothetical protein